MQRQKGFTIVEVSVGATIIIIILGALYGLQSVMNTSQGLILNQSIKVELANSAMQTLIREIRTARDGDNGAYAIENANNQTLTFYSDVDFDGQTEKVRYFINGTELRKGVIEPLGYPVTYPPGNEQVRVITDNVRNGALPLFYFFSGNFPTQGNPLSVPADPDSIKLVRVHVRLNEKVNDPQGDYVLESNTAIRTLKNNL